MSVLFVAKLALAPAVVASGSVAGRRWGHQVGGLVAGFPNTSSPILLFLALERGIDFAATAAVSVLLGLAALAAYGLVYTWSAKRLPWWLSLPLGWAAFLGVAWSLKRAEPSLALATALAIASLTGAAFLMPRFKEPGAPRRPRRWDVPLRMGLAIALLLGITRLAGWLGPGLAGILSAFPIASSVLTASAHRDHGAAGAERVLKGIFLALNALILFTALLPLLLPALGLWAGFALAGALGFVAQALLIWQREDLAGLAA
jgi:hypothetical protein